MCVCFSLSQLKSYHFSFIGKIFFASFFYDFFRISIDKKDVYCHNK